MVVMETGFALVGAAILVAFVAPLIAHIWVDYVNWLERKN